MSYREGHVRNEWSKMNSIACTRLFCLPDRASLLFVRDTITKVLAGQPITHEPQAVDLFRFSRQLESSS